MTTTDPGEDFAALMKEFDAKSASGGRKRPAFELGQTVRGKIVSIGREQAFIDLGSSKAEAMLDLIELHDAEGRLTAKVGDEIEARIVEMGGETGSVLLRKSFGRNSGGDGEGSAELEQAFNLGVPVQGTVTTVNRGGVEVLVAGVRAFCPISQIDLRHTEDPSVFIGQKLDFQITRCETDRRGANVVLSRRALLEKDARARADVLRAKLVVGAVVPGVVTTLKDYGAFVDIGGIEGMLHVSEIGYSRTARPADVLSVGQPLQVQILKIEKTDDPKRPERISLSLKSMAEDPWAEAVQRFGPGTKAKGTVTRVEAFGAFVELAPGLEGLLPIGELGDGKPLRHARDAVKAGQAVDVTVLSVDRERRRLSLGLGDRTDSIDAEGAAAAQRMSAPGRLGTFGDLLKKKL